jgi:N-acetylglucosaminyldiphosphoundecaprenol N-acetyl-beta-D-mannosaminyltransferase
VWTVGALFDYVSGRVPRAPHWMADHGLEWIFRLALEPRRMWRRYLLGNPVFLWRVWGERNGRREEIPVELPITYLFQADERAAELVEDAPARRRPAA